MITNFKIFESIEHPKKYMVFYLINSDKFFIDTLIEYEKNIKLKYIMSYEYNTELDILQKKDETDISVTQSGNIDINNYLKYILFTSNNLNDCLNFIKININSKKYNI